MLGIMYYRGRGVPVDIDKALQLWNEAADRGSATTIRTSIAIDKPCSVVWSVLTNADTWETWYGAKLIKVIPSWQKGAEFIWESDGRSTVIDFVAGKRLSTIDNSYKLIKNYTITESGEMTAIVTFDKDFGRSTLSVANINPGL